MGTAHAMPRKSGFENADRKNNGIERYQQPAKAHAREYSYHAHAQKESDSDADRHEQNGIIDMRHRLREHLKIGLGYRHGKAEDEAGNKYHQV